MKMKSFLLGVLLLASANWARAETQVRHNVIFIFIYDLGWGDIGCYGIDSPQPKGSCKSKFRQGKAFNLLFPFPFWDSSQEDFFK